MALENTFVLNLAYAISHCDKNAIVNVAKDILAAGIDPELVIEKGLMPGIAEIESRFGQGRISIPALIATECVAREARDILLSQTPDENPLKRPVTIVIGIASGEPHSIGKSISLAMLTSRGITCYDLGEDVPSERFVEKAQEVNADVMAIGTLVISSMRYQKEVIDILNEKGIRDSHKVIIGGRTEIITPSFAEEIGSDACGIDIKDFVEKIQKLADDKLES